MSVLFVANGRSASILGINRLLVRVAGDNPCLYHGVIGPCAIDKHVFERLRTDVLAIVAELELRGLNSVDFVLSGEQTYWLEINPRPPSSFELYDSPARNLLEWHIRGSRGETLPDWPRSLMPANGIRIVHARAALKTPPMDFWPSWCRDRPQPFGRLEAGSPICTIAAFGKDDAAVEHLLDERETSLLRRLDDFRMAHWMIGA